MRTSCHSRSSCAQSTTLHPHLYLQHLYSSYRDHIHIPELTPSQRRPSLPFTAPEPLQ